jgi:hypothetical protein
VLKIMVWILAWARVIFCSPNHPTSVHLVPGTDPRGKAASAKKVTTHLPLMPRLRMSGAVRLNGVHRENVMHIVHSLSCQDSAVVMAAEVLKVLLLNGCNIFFISLCCTYVSIQSWSETVMLIIRCVNCLNCVVNMWVVCWLTTISFIAKIIVSLWWHHPRCVIKC